LNSFNKLLQEFDLIGKVFPIKYTDLTNKNQVSFYHTVRKILKFD